MDSGVLSRVEAVICYVIDSEIWLAEMPLELREAGLLYYGWGFTIAEVGAKMQRNPRQVARTLFALNERLMTDRLPFRALNVNGIKCAEFAQLCE